MDIDGFLRCAAAIQVEQETAKQDYEKKIMEGNRNLQKIIDDYVEEHGRFKLGDEVIVEKSLRPGKTKPVLFLIGRYGYDFKTDQIEYYVFGIKKDGSPGKHLNSMPIYERDILKI